MGRKRLLADGAGKTKEPRAQREAAPCGTDSIHRHQLKMDRHASTFTRITMNFHKLIFGREILDMA